MKRVIHTDLAPQPIGSYSQAVLAGDTLYLAGQIGLNPVTHQLAESLEEQLNQAFLNMASVLQAAGLDINHVVKLTVYLKNFAEDYSKIDAVINDFFVAPFPARTTLGVSALPRNALVEIDVVAVTI